MPRIESGQSYLFTQKDKNSSFPEYTNWNNIIITLASNKPDKDKLAHIPSLGRIGDSQILKCKNISPEIPSNIVNDREWLKIREKIRTAIKKEIISYCLQNSRTRFYIDRMIHGRSYSDKPRTTADILTHRLFLEAVEEVLLENPAWESSIYFLD